MELLSSSLFIPASFLVSVLLILDILLKQMRRRRSVKLPPGPWKLPLIGNLHQLVAGGSLPWRTFRQLARKHGPIMHLQIGQVTTVVVSSPRLAKEILQTHDLSFLDRPELFGSDILFYNKSDMAFSPYGDYWKQMRKVCVMELLSHSKVISYRTIRENEVSGLVSSLQLSSSSPINLTKKLFKLSSFITCRTAFGSNFEGQDELLPMIGNVVGFLGQLNVADVIPSLAFLNVISGIKRKLQSTHHKFDSVFDNMINDYRTNWLERTRNTTTPSSSSPVLEDENILDALIRLQQCGDFQLKITDQNIKGMILDLFIAGTDTSSTTMDWALSEMLRNPKVLEKAQAEVRHVVGENKTVSEIDISRLYYLKMVVKETLRLHPPMPLLVLPPYRQVCPPFLIGLYRQDKPGDTEVVPRQCREACQIDGYTIPVKTRVMVNAWAIGRDPTVWDDAETFKPERFENSAIDFKGTDFELLPFSAGRKMCPGISFGISVIEIALAKLLYHFDWKLPQGMNPTDLSMEESFGIVGKRKDELYLIPIPWDGNPIESKMK